jgi:FtsZ-binding cell division protein ZapB
MDKVQIPEAEFLELEQKIEKFLTVVEAIKQENQKLKEEINRLQTEKASVIERINLLLDKIDELL